MSYAARRKVLVLLLALLLPLGLALLAAGGCRSGGGSDSKKNSGGGTTQPPGGGGGGTQPPGGGGGGGGTPPPSGGGGGGTPPPSGGGGGGTPPPSGGGGIFLPGGSPASVPPPTPQMAGTEIVVSPGHGYLYYDSLGTWSTQRGLHHGLLEDIHTNEIAIDHLLPSFEAAGVRVTSCRMRDKNRNEVVLHNESAHPAYQEWGTWQSTTTSGLGFGGSSYRYANASTTETAAAWFVPSFPAAGRYSVWAWYPAAANRTTDAHYVVFHSGGFTIVSVDQTRNGSRWNYLGTFYFEAAGNEGVALSNQSSAAGVVVADAVRFGGGMGDFVEPSGTSGQPRWKECARAYVPWVGAGFTGGDVTIRPTYADWQGADAYISLHTNAANSTGTGSAKGTVTYTHDTNPSAGSVDLARSVQTQLIGDIRALWDSTWNDRGLNTANFGEVRECRTMPAILIELAFHDTPSWDAKFLRDEAFRRDAARAIYKGAARYLFGAGIAVTPPTPTHLAVQNAGGNAIRVSWRAGVDPVETGNGAIGYKVYGSVNGYGFDNGVYTLDRSLLFTNLAPGTTYFFRVTAVNAGGESRPTEVLAARVDPQGRPGEVLVVNGYDRLDEFQTIRRGEQTFDFVVQHARAIEQAGRGFFTFDSASNEAVEAGDVALAGYAAVDWMLGNESSRDESFSAGEQSVVNSYLAAGGRLLVTGAEVGWDLGHLGSSGDQTFLSQALRASYVADDAGSDTIAPVSGSIFAGLAPFGYGAAQGGAYEVGYPDALAPASGAAAALTYSGTSYTAAVDGAVGAGRVIYFGFPFETIAGANERAQVMTRVLDAFMPGHP